MDSFKYDQVEEDWDMECRKRQRGVTKGREEHMWWHGSEMSGFEYGPKRRWTTNVVDLKEI